MNKSLHSMPAVRRATGTLSVAFALATGFGALIQPASAATIEKIERRGILEICANPDAMPYSTAFEGPKGLHVDLANAFAKELGVSASFSWVQFRFQSKFTRCDAYMGVGVFPDDEDDGPVKKTKPILDFETVFVSKPGLEFKKIEDLHGRKIAVQTGSLAHVALLDRPVDVRVSYIRENDLLAAVDSGEIDGGFVSNVGLGWYRKNNPGAELASSSAAVIQKPTGYPIAIGLRKADRATLARFNELIDKLRASGEMDRIMDRYGIADLQTGKH